MFSFHFLFSFFLSKTALKEYFGAVLLFGFFIFSLVSLHFFHNGYALCGKAVHKSNAALISAPLCKGSRERAQSPRFSPQQLRPPLAGGPHPSRCSAQGAAPRHLPQGGRLSTPSPLCPVPIKKGAAPAAKPQCPRRARFMRRKACFMRRKPRFMRRRRASCAEGALHCAEGALHTPKGALHAA